MPRMIKSKSSLFRGEMIEQPRQAKAIYDAEGSPIYTCPYCKKQTDEDSCGVLGAEPGGLFCPNCGREFYA